MRRVLVIGSGGSGKSAVAAKIGAILDLPVIHLDALYWKPGWTPTDATEWKRRVRELASRDAWVMDGNYGGTLDIRLAACDTVVFLDMPRALCLWRVMRRWLRHRGQTRPDMAGGCPERLTWEFLVWVWTYPRRRRGSVLARLSALSREKHVIILRSPLEVDRLVASLAQRAA